MLMSITHLTHAIVRSHGLSQVVSNVTHIHHNGVSSIIDLVLLSFPSQLIKCCTIPPLANSDHIGIVKWNPVSAPTHHRRTMWRSAHADWDKARELISSHQGTNLFIIGNYFWQMMLMPHGTIDTKNLSNEEKECKIQAWEAYRRLLSI